jgi:hypothetical protein
MVNQTVPQIEISFLLHWIFLVGCWIFRRSIWLRPFSSRVPVDRYHAGHVPRNLQYPRWESLWLPIFLKAGVDTREHLMSRTAWSTKRSCKSKRPSFFIGYSLLAVGYSAARSGFDLTLPGCLWTVISLATHPRRDWGTSPSNPAATTGPTLQPATSCSLWSAADSLPFRVLQ